MAGKQSITQLLSALRAPIFNTLAPTSNARTGNKYLRRRLRGPSVVAYLPPKVRRIGAYNDRYSRLVGGGDLSRQARYILPPAQAVPPGCEPVERNAAAGPPVSRWETAKTAGVFLDEKEKLRFEDVARKKKLGKGPPTKGQGKRASLKKK